LGKQKLTVAPKLFLFFLCIFFCRSYIWFPLPKKIVVLVVTRKFVGRGKTQKDFLEKTWYFFSGGPGLNGLSKYKAKFFYVLDKNCPPQTEKCPKAK